MKITYVSGTRADFGLMRPVLDRIRDDPAFELDVLVTGMHLQKKCGHTVDEIEKAGFSVLPRINAFPSGDTPFHMVQATGKAVLGMSKIFQKHPPDVLLLLGDRWEQLAAAIAAAQMNIAIAHVHGGERSGGIDESQRHAISRFSHVHFVANKDSESRLLRMGEEPFRIHRVGAPAVDALRKMRFPSRGTLARTLRIPIDERLYIVLVQHPVSWEASDSREQIEETLAAFSKLDVTCIAFAPNSDPGAKAIWSALDRARRTKPGFYFVTHVEWKTFVALLKHAQALVGNSSSGIVECPYLEVPTVNIGTRQRLRYRGKNVIDVAYDRKEISSALKWITSNQGFRKTLQKDRFVYGDGNAGKRITQILKRFPWNDRKVLQKKVTY